MLVFSGVLYTFMVNAVWTFCIREDTENPTTNSLHYLLRKCFLIHHNKQCTLKIVHHECILYTHAYDKIWISFPVIIISSSDCLYIQPRSPHSESRKLINTVRTLSSPIWSSLIMWIQSTCGEQKHAVCLTTPQALDPLASLLLQYRHATKYDKVGSYYLTFNPNLLGYNASQSTMSTNTCETSALIFSA